MSVLITRPNADNVIELEDDKNFVCLSVAWEWNRARYIFEIDMKNLPNDWEAFVRSHLHRDEAMTVEQVIYL
jgi:hypothetical protein